jgi:LCP family protein required for cell wall assembly
MAVLVGDKRLVRRGLSFQWWWLIWVAAAVCTFLLGVALGVLSGGGGGASWFGQFLTPAFGGRERVTVLAVGVDSSEGRGLGDAIILAVVGPRTGELAALSIPRDSRVYIPRAGVHRINVAHAIGGTPLTIETVELLLGVPIDHYIEVDVPALTRLIDAVGGVDIDVEKRMYYRDRSQNLLIDLQPGPQRLDGEQAVGYVRFRHDAMGDLGRIERQRKFLRAAFRRILAPDNVARIVRLAQVFIDTVQTDLTPRELLLLKRLVEQAGADGVRMATLPGVPRTLQGQSVLQIEPEEAQQLVDRIVWGRGLSVEILNGTDVAGLAARTAARLEQYGCEIVDVGNASEKRDTTLVVDHRASTRRAKRVAALLGLGVVSAAPEGDNPADVTVVLGRDVLGAGR